MPIPSYALPHMARVVRTVRAGARDAQGERVPTVTPGKWFAARRMTPRPSQRPRDDAGARDEPVTWALLWGDEYDDGTPLTSPPRPSDAVELVLSDDAPTQAELDALVVVPLRYEVVTPRQIDTGIDVIGGQASLVEVVPDA